MANRHVLIIGAGRIGQVLASLIHDGDSDVEVHLWDKNPSIVVGQPALDELVPHASVIFCCTPSWTVRDVLTNILPSLQAQTAIITLAKGCEASTGKTMAEVADELLPAEQPHAVLGGPMLAETLQHGHRGIGVVGSTDQRVYALAVALFKGTRLHIVADADPHGVALAGVLKNVYAFLVGVGVGLGWTDAQQRSFFVKAKHEFLTVGQAINVSAATMNGPAGIDDFLETATSPLSHNHHVGEMLGHTGKLPGECEATISYPTIARRLNGQHFPLLDMLRTLLVEHQPPTLLNEFLQTTHS